jgi:hypothetical protein
MCTKCPLGEGKQEHTECNEIREKNTVRREKTGRKKK